MAENESFLGSGWSFPPTFTKRGVELVHNADDIAESIEILLNTSLGERIMRPEFGCNLRDFLFKSITTSKIFEIKEMIRTALTYFEARIDLHSVEIDHSGYLDGIILIQVDYSVAKTNSRYNLVFPYYSVEGSDLPRLMKSTLSKTNNL
jgi:phage baseplate assembly protein W